MTPLSKIPSDFSREDLEAAAEWLRFEPQTVNVGNVTGEGDEHLPSAASIALGFITAYLAQAAPEPTAPEHWKGDTAPGQYKAEEGVWLLVSPSGKKYPGTSPMKALQAESKSRIPAKVALARIYEGMQEDAGTGQAAIGEGEK